MPSAKTARKVTAATRANATIRVLKRSGVTAGGCFCGVVSSATAAVASAIGMVAKFCLPARKDRHTFRGGPQPPSQTSALRAAAAGRRRLEMGDEASAAIPAQRIKLFTVVSACTLATAFLTVFALGAVYHPGPPVAALTPALVAPVDSSATPITSTRRAGLQRRTRWREGSPMWAGDPKKVLMKTGKGKGAGKAGGKKVGKILPLLERIRNKHKITEVAGLPQTSLEKHAT